MIEITNSYISDDGKSIITVYKKTGGLPAGKVFAPYVPFNTNPMKFGNMNEDQIVEKIDSGLASIGIAEPIRIDFVNRFVGGGFKLLSIKQFHLHKEFVYNGRFTMKYVDDTGKLGHWKGYYNYSQCQLQIVPL